MKRLILFLVKKYATYDRSFRIEICKVLQDRVANQYYEDNIYDNFYTAAGEMMRANPLYKSSPEGITMLAKGLKEELSFLNSN